MSERMRAAVLSVLLLIFGCTVWELGSRATSTASGPEAGASLAAGAQVARLPRPSGIAVFAEVYFESTSQPAMQWPQ